MLLNSNQPLFPPKSLRVEISRTHAAIQARSDREWTPEVVCSAYSTTPFISINLRRDSQRRGGAL